MKKILIDTEKNALRQTNRQHWPVLIDRENIERELKLKQANDTDNKGRRDYE